MGRTRLLKAEMDEAYYQELSEEVRCGMTVVSIEPYDKPNFSDDPIWSILDEKARTAYREKKKREEQLKK